MQTHADATFPHSGACGACYEASQCNYCGADISVVPGCTNGRCRECHRNICTADGATSPGHGFGKAGSDWSRR